MRSAFIGLGLVCLLLPWLLWGCLRGGEGEKSSGEKRQEVIGVAVAPFDGGQVIIFAYHLVDA